MSLSTNAQSYNRPKRWLITGGCGFIGLNLVKNLVDEGGHYIRIVDNLSVGTREDLLQVCKFTELNSANLFQDSSQSVSPNHGNTVVELVAADILDAELALKATKEIECIVHLAANAAVETSVDDPRLDCLNNVIGTLNYLEAARSNHVQRFIFASSVAPVGECDTAIHEELAPRPVSPYGASKLSGEAYCSAYFRTFGIKTVALRFGNVYGPLSSHKNSVVAKFIRRAMESKPLQIYGDGTQTRDFIYIDDLIQAIRLAAISNRAGGETFQIATNAETSITKLVDQLLTILIDSKYNDVVVHHTDPRLGDIRRNFSDTSKAKRILGWQSKFELVDGLKRTIKWFTEKYP